MVSDILNKVQSPFSDELIEFLIRQYIEKDCDKKLFYESINNLDLSSKEQYDEAVSKLIDQIYAHGTDIRLLCNHKGEVPKLIYDITSSWIFLQSEQDPMKDKELIEKPLVYRIYLNLNRTEKVKFVTEYLSKCKENNMSYELKFSTDELRKDQIIILSRAEELEKNISFVEELTSNVDLGELPILVGKYKNNIGIAEEYYDRDYSPTSLRLALVSSSIKKYLLDYKVEFYDKLTEDERDKIDSIEKSFNHKYENILKKMSRDGDSYVDRKKKRYQRKSSIDCVKEHIETARNSNSSEYILKEIKEIVKQAFLVDQEKFLTKTIQNYRMIGNDVWGISKDFIFSVDTEKEFLQKKHENINKENEYEER